ncbi:hypothetical protein B0H13DRAFT_2236571 [Mycena leptocephala]|nr:hypothetical protein B0H13DRAFT_2236571 [Mycena leptocephala]
MSGHARANAEIILALSKMGIYMERDRTKLDALSPSTQNTRLRKAFDRAVENCCIFQLLFQKEQREMGKLVLTGLPEWDDWRVSRGEIVKQGRQNAPAEFIIHFVDRPCSIGILLQKQTGIVGTSLILMPNGGSSIFLGNAKGDCIEVDLEDLPDQSLGW